TTPPLIIVFSCVSIVYLLCIFRVPTRYKIAITTCNGEETTRIPAWADYCVEEMTQDVDVVTHDDVTHDDDDVTHMMKTTAFRRPREHRSTRMCSLTILLLECVLLLEHRSTQLTTRSSRGNAL
ncbi:MAG: hypothetical protein ACK55Z_04805, partial [bacterium]